MGLAATVASFYNELPGSNNAGAAGGAGMPAILPSPMVPSLGLPAAAAGRRGGVVPLAAAAAPSGGGAGPGGDGGGASGVGGAGGSMVRGLQPAGTELSQALQVCCVKRAPEGVLLVAGVR